MNTDFYLINCQHVSFCVSNEGQNRAILEDINFKIMPQEIATVIGPNGAGKTTLLRILLKLLLPSSGRVFYKQNLRIGYMPQRLSLNSQLPITVERFLQLSVDKYNFYEKIDPFLSQVQALHLKKQKLLTLSGGELQRIMLARALLKNPDILVLDEPTQGVDVMGQRDFYQLLSNLQQSYKCSVLLVSHDLHLVMAQTNQVICLNHHICCSGTPDLVQNHPSYQALFPYITTYTHHHDHHHL